MRRLQAMLLLITAASITACLPFGAQRSKPRVAEIETTSRAGGTSAPTVRSEVDYLDDGRVDEITRTAGGNFVDRWELTYDDNRRVEEVAIISDGETVIIELSYTGELLTEASALLTESETELRWDISYLNGDRRLIDSMAVTSDGPSYFSETASSYSYDDRSRIAEIASSTFTESSAGTTGETSSTTELRFDSDTGKLERVTSTVEVPYYPAPVVDWCWDAGYYTDTYCDSTCPQPDPACGGTTVPVAPDQGEPEIRTSTQLYSVKYDDEGRLEEMDGPDGERVAVEYDAEHRIDEIEQRNDGYSVITEYTYDDGVVNGHSFSPALPHGELFDLTGASFGTLDFESPMDLVAGVVSGSSAGASASDDGGF